MAMKKVMKKGYKKGGMAKKPMAKKGINNAGFKALPSSVQASIKKNMKDAEKGMSMMKKAYAKMGKVFKK